MVAVKRIENNLANSIIQNKSILQMQTRKRSFDEISFELTQKNIEIQSKCLLPSNVQLQYSQSAISIQNGLDSNQNDLPMTIHIQHEESDKFHLLSNLNQGKAKTLHVLHFTDNLYDCFSQAIQKLKLFNTPQLKRKVQKTLFKDVPKSISYSAKKYQFRNISKDSLKIEEKSLSKRSKTLIHSRFAGSIKQNQQSYDNLKNRENEEKKRCKIVIKPSEKNHFKKKVNIQHQNNTNLTLLNSAMLTRRLQLSHNQLQQKKYLQKVIMNRQSILHSNHKICLFPII